MGFMDKAKKLAEQAQEKLDEAQTQFNQKQGGQGQPEQGSNVRYDDHGRPIQDPPAGSAPPPSAEPAQPADPAEAPAPAGEQEPPDTGGANASPDPFKPIQ
jgi:hypothetical protein